MLFLRDVLNLNAEAVEKAYDMSDGLIVNLRVKSYERERFDKIAKELVTSSEMPWDNATNYIIGSIFDAVKEVIKDTYPNAEFKTVIDGKNSSIDVVSRSNLIRKEED